MAQEKAVKVPSGGPGRRMAMGGGPKVENPGKVFKRIMAYVMKNYAIQYVIVLLCILGSVLANVQGTLFLKNLIDVYILPMLSQSQADFTPLLMAIARVALFYLLGVACAFTQQKIMIYVTQGTMMRLRNDLFSHMSRLPIRYFDTHTHGDIMSRYTNDTDALSQMISQSLPNVFSSAITIITTFFAMLVSNAYLTGVVILSLFIMLNITKRIAGNSAKYFIQRQKAVGEVNRIYRRNDKWTKGCKGFLS